MTELKPCPFCGGEAKIIVCDREGNLHDEGYEQNPWSGLGYLIFHKSEDCPVGHSYPDDVRWMYDTEAEAIEAWNTRAEGDNDAEIFRDVADGLFCDLMATSPITAMVWAKAWPELFVKAVDDAN